MCAVLSQRVLDSRPRKWILPQLDESSHINVGNQGNHSKAFLEADCNLDNPAQICPETCFLGVQLNTRHHSAQKLSNFSLHYNCPRDVLKPRPSNFLHFLFCGKPVKILHEQIQEILICAQMIFLVLGIHITLKASGLISSSCFSSFLPGMLLRATALSSPYLSYQCYKKSWILHKAQSVIHI